MVHNLGNAPHKWGLILNGDAMKDTESSSARATIMTLKNRDDQASREFWDYVEQSKKDWQAQRPSWSRELEQRQERSSAQPQREPTTSLVCR
jgi:hypothetical protein